MNAARAMKQAERQSLSFEDSDVITEINRYVEAITMKLALASTTAPENLDTKGILFDARRLNELNERHKALLAKINTLDEELG
ncbi:MAG: hypothetical protein EPN22_16950 [Nitrospirae bacterium]|nr:MAG: hypothetical protein EPN22_16950 [Nitrospirota bacterium]